jgi:hypothetical protein
VNCTVAVTPWGAGAVSESWTAFASGLGGGFEPPEPAARAIAVPAAITASTAAQRRTRCLVEMRRRSDTGTKVRHPL